MELALEHHASSAAAAAGSTPRLLVRRVDVHVAQDEPERVVDGIDRAAERLDLDPVSTGPVPVTEARVVSHSPRR